MLALHKIELEPKDRAFLTKLFQNGDLIKYKEATHLLSIDMDSAAFDEKKWTVTRPEQTQKQPKDTESKVTAKALKSLLKDDQKQSITVS